MYSDGPEFVLSILQSGIISTLLNILCSSNCCPWSSVSILRCLNAIADSLPPSGPSGWREDKHLADLLYRPSFISCFTQLITQAFRSPSSENACSLALLLVSKTCTDDKEKIALAIPELLTALAVRLASFIVADGYVFPNTDVTEIGLIPSPAPPYAHLSLTLQIITLLTEQSKSRGHQILMCPAILATMPKWQNDFSVADPRRPAWTAFHSLSTPSRIKCDNPLDALLPAVPQTLASLSAEQTNFPPLGAVVPGPKRRTSMLRSDAKSNPGNLFPTEKPEDDETPLVGWLLQVVRTKDKPCRLMAARYLVTLLQLGFVRKSRMRLLGMILVPLLVRMIDHNEVLIVQRQNKGGIFPASVENGLQVPEVLAFLIMDDEALQKAAVDAGAIKGLAQAFKSTFDHAQHETAAMWTPEKGDKAQVQSLPSKQRIDKRGPSSILRQTMRYREGLLKALAAIAPFNDDYRKAICDQGILPCLIDSLKPLPANVAEIAGRTLSTAGNPAPTLLAACSVTQALTRSVSALRTNLIDAGIASPIVKLLSNGDPEVKIAATRVVGNLAMDFSPMKEIISRQNVIRHLCEQAHSANPRLRFESIWALKQLVLNSPNSVKINVIQELGPSWIKQLISTDPLDIPPGVVIGLIDMDFPPRTQYLDHLSSTGDDVVMIEASGSGESKDNGQAQQQEPIEETDPNRHTIQDDTAIQEQLLDFLRNLFCGEKACEVIDYVFSEMDQREFFDIMLARLRSRTVHGPTRKENKSLPPPSGVVAKVLWILVHIAASRSRFRSLIASNSALLRQVLVHCGHPNPEIRAQISWIAINLTYLESKAEEPACKQRAADLNKAGYLSKLTSMLDDGDMDVRERTKTAVHLLREYLT